MTSEYLTDLHTHVIRMGVCYDCNFYLVFVGQDFNAFHLLKGKKSYKQDRKQSKFKQNNKIIKKKNVNEFITFFLVAFVCEKNDVLSESVTNIYTNDFK